MISLILFRHMLAPHIMARVASFANGDMDHIKYLFHIPKYVLEGKRPTACVTGGWAG